MGRINREDFEKNGGRLVLCRNPENVEEDNGPNEDVWPVEYCSKSLREFLEHEELEQDFIDFCDETGRHEVADRYLITPDAIELSNDDILEFSDHLNQYVNDLYGVIYHAD